MASQSLDREEEPADLPASQRDQRIRRPRPGGVGALLLIATMVGGPAAWSATQSAQAPPAPPMGRVLDDIVSQADPSQTYSVFLPSTYRADRSWPLLLVLDARGQGHEAAELFAAGAEAQGFIILSSDLSRSDDDARPNLRAVAAMLEDARRSLAVDPKRLYIAGLSGTARFAWALAIRGDDALPGMGPVTGVITCSGGLPDGDPRWKKPTFAAFGTAGLWDFNYSEMLAQDAVSAEHGVPHRLETFEGGHRWPPSSVAAEALEWLRIQAMRSGLETPDAAWLERIWERRRAQARTLEEIGDHVAALGRYRDLVTDFPDHPGVAELREHIGSLAAEPEVVRRQKLLAKVLEREKPFRAKVALATRALKTENSPDAGKLMQDLGIEDLKRQAAEAGDVEERDGAKRYLAIVTGQTSFYLPRELFAKGRYGGAAAALEIALTIRPENPELWYNLACARARLGQAEGAIEALRRARDEGFSDPELLATDPDLEAVRDEPGFAHLLERLRTSEPRPGTSLAPL